jgi:isopentenyl phosphate kinase
LNKRTNIHLENYSIPLKGYLAGRVSTFSLLPQFLDSHHALCQNDAMLSPIFLKLGGSLITDKTLPYTPRLDKLEELAAQIANVIGSTPSLPLVLGHGSGSFGHTAAKQYGTRNGVKSPEQWRGFADVWYQASELNRYVMQALRKAGVPAVALAPISAITARDGQVAYWDLNALKSSLDAGLVPVIYGDVIFDEIRGGTILSTEDLFGFLARELRPQKILLAGLEGGVWADFPDRKIKVEKITPTSFGMVSAGVGKSNGADVTGGMETKVKQMLDLVQQVPGLTAQIFSGEEPGNVERVFRGEIIGTLIAAE